MLRAFFKRHASFIVCVGILFVVRGTFADQNRVPSGSMEPTIQVGDHLLVNRIAYDLKVPFSEITLKELRSPARGDIIVFHNPESDIRMVKRLIGLPGDHLQVHNGRVVLNGRAIPGSETVAQEMLASPADEFYYRERIGTHVATIKRTKSLMREFADVDLVIPADKYFAMGDNRDNSFDSRGWGLIPRGKIVGRAEAVLFNVNFLPVPAMKLERIGLIFS